MRPSNGDRIARKFSNLNFHDDDLVSVTIQAPRRAADPAKIDFEFRDYSTREKKILTISGCANLRWFMDFDVLGDNWFAQTEGATARTNVQEMRKFVLVQAPHWHVKYMPPSPKDKPIRKKLSSIRKYVLFRVSFFGGIVHVLAKNFTLRRSRGLHK